MYSVAQDQLRSGSSTALNEASSVCPKCQRIIIGDGVVVQRNLYHPQCAPAPPSSTSSPSTGGLFQFNEKYVSTGAAPAMQLVPLLTVEPNYSFALEEKVLLQAKAAPARKMVEIFLLDGGEKKSLKVPAGGVTVNYLYTKCGYDVADYNVELCMDATGKLLLDKQQVLELGEGDALRVAAQKRAEVGEVLVPCEFCGSKIKIADLQTHKCNKAEDNDSIPCEKCNSLIPADEYLAHEQDCGK